MKILSTNEIAKLMGFKFKEKGISPYFWVMNYIPTSNRMQMRISSLEEQIEADNPVRFTEAFVEQLALSQLGYITSTLKSEGRPPFHPNVFLKMYLYGYLNGIHCICVRSMRKKRIQLARPYLIG